MDGVAKTNIITIQRIYDAFRSLHAADIAAIYRRSSPPPNNPDYLVRQICFIGIGWSVLWSGWEKGLKVEIT